MSIKDLYVQLIVVNLIIFLFANIARSLGSSLFIDWFALPFENPLSKFWTIITYNFLHQDFGHVFNNMIILLLFGSLTQYFFKKQSILSIYLLGGIAGAILMLVVGKSMGTESVVIGASCAVFAIMVAATVYQPNYTVNLIIIGPVKLKWITLTLVVLTVVINFTCNIMGNIGHIGGGLFGLFYGLQYRKGKNIAYGMDKWFKKIGLGTGVSQPNSPHSTRSMTKKELVDAARPKRSASLNMDTILDKISKKGMSSLSKEEKDYLNNS